MAPNSVTSLKQFIREIHRRSLWQVLSIYLVAGWVAIEVVQTLTESLGLPGWFPAFAVVLLVVGLPVVLATAVVQEGIGGGRSGPGDGSDAGVDREPGPGEGDAPTSGAEAAAASASPAVRRLFTWRNAISGGVLALALWGVVAAGWLLLGGTAGAADEGGTPVEKSIAVLPFENLSADPENAFFASGIHEDILTHLSKVGDLRVISRSSVMKYAGPDLDLRQVAEELGVAHILEGSVRRSGNRVRITAQLIDARNDEHVWASNFDRDLADVFEIQTTVAKEIVGHLQAQLSPEEQRRLAEAPTDDLEAYDLYLKARELTRTGQLDTEKEREAARLLESAVERDPEFALAYVELADVSGDLYWFAERTPERLNRMKAAIDRAFELKPDLPEARAVLGEYYYRGFYDYERALEQLEIAHRQLPNNADILYMLGLTLRRLGRWDESVRSFEESTILDPENLRNYGELLDTMHDAMRWQEGIAAAERAHARWPDSGLISAHLVMLLLHGRGDTATARRVLAAAGPLEEWYWVQASFSTALYTGDLNGAADVAGQYAHILDVLVPGNSEFFRAEVAVLRGDETSARELFQRARAKLEAEAAKPYAENYVWPHLVLAMVDGYLGRRARVMESCARARGIMTPETDRVHGPWVTDMCAFARARLGDIEEALDMLEGGIDVPSGYMRWELALDPRWDFLRDNPRFQALTAQPGGGR